MYGLGNLLELCDVLGLSPSDREGLGALFYVAHWGFYDPYMQGYYGNSEIRFLSVLGYRISIDFLVRARKILGDVFISILRTVLTEE